MYLDITENLKKSAQRDRGITIIYSKDEQKPVSYADVLKRSLRLGSYLHQRGVQKTDYALIFCKDVMNLIYSFWACALGGYIAVILPYDAQNGLNKDFLKFHSYGAILTDTDLQLPGWEEKIVRLDRGAWDDASFDEAPYEAEHFEDDIVYVQFSSGTTGTAKEIPIRRKNISANMLDEIEIFGITDEDVVLNWHSLAHSGGLVIFHLMAVVMGLPLYIIPDSVYIRNPLLWMDMIDRYHATLTGSIPFAMRGFLNVYHNTDREIQWDLSSLRVMTLGAERVGFDVFEAFTTEMKKYHLRPGVIVPAYGLTESTCLLGYAMNDGHLETYTTMQKGFVYGDKTIKYTGQEQASQFILYSKLSSSVEIRITDEEDRELPMGSIGKIWIRGGAVIDGYLIDGKIVKESHFDGDWYDTGDLGSLVSERQLVVMGRSKEVVVLAGINYECALIEGTIRSIPTDGLVNETVICNVMGKDGTEQVVAFGVCQQPWDTKEFKERFQKFKEEVQEKTFMAYGITITDVVPIKELPRTKSNKLKRNDLGTYYTKEYLTKNPDTQKQSEPQFENREDVDRMVKDTLTDIIAELIGMKVTNYDLTFQEYGIVSVNIIEMVARCNEILHTKIKASDVFNYPTISGFIHYVARTLYKTHETTVRPADKTVQPEEDAVAIVGMSCRFPNGANSVNEYWENLINGVDGITEVPEGRWDKEKYYSKNQSEPGKMYCKKAGFLNVPIDTFDAKFFNISPKEAAAVDPQARLLLELTYEAFENGGMDITDYSGTKTGVYIGVSADDYGEASVSSGDLSRIDSYSLTGVSHSTICGRISYLFGFEGGCFSVDTACSSALIALHLAAEAVKNHEVDTAVVGGTNLLISPAVFVAFSRLHAISPDGQCRSFDADANGYARSEGAGVILLKRLSDAKRDHDHILGIVKGTGINQDGKSNGMTAPNGESQKKLIQDTLEKLDLAPESIGYVEAHGTGTPLGDPIEVNALIDTYGKGRTDDNPLRIGSVKSNIGHLEAASGMASIIKVLLSFEHQMIPANLNFKTPNPEIRWEDAPLQVVASNTEWKAEGPVRRAAIDSFGFGGSNAHVILEEYREETEPYAAAKTEPENYILKISAKSESGLKQLAKRYIEVLDKTEQEKLPALLMTANQGRADYTNRLAVYGTTREELVSGLKDYAVGKNSAAVSVSDGTKAERIVFLFTGQGSQYVNMCRELYDGNAVFREKMQQCDKLFRPYILASILDLIYAENADEDMVNQTCYAQPLIFAVEYSLAAMWQSYGISPSVVLGHSIGEYAAAVIAGIMTLETAVELVACRGRLMGSAPGCGAMATIFVDEDLTTKLMEGCPHCVIAVKNARESCVVSGPKEEVEAVCRRAEQERGIRTRMLKVSHAFHSPLMEPAAKQFAYIAEGKEYHKAEIEFISTVYARQIGKNEILDADYWTNQILKPVNFYHSVSALENTENLFLIEIGATNTLTSLCRMIFDGKVCCVASADRSASARTQFYSAFASAYTHGVSIDWSKLGYDADFIRSASLPNYPFEREQYWHELLYDRKNHFNISQSSVHSLLGQRIESVCMEDTVIFQREYQCDKPFFMGEHIIFDTAIAPAASYVSILISAMKELRNPKSISILDMELREPLIVNEDETRTVQICISKAYSDQCEFKIASRLTDGVNAQWIIHSQGKISVNEREYLASEEAADVGKWEEQGYQEIADDTKELSVYQAFTDSGFKLGEGFRRVRRSACGNKHGICYVEPHPSLPYEEEYLIYPGVVDSIFHTMFCVSLADGFAAGSGTMIPYFMTRISFNYYEFDKLWCSSTTITENNSFVGGSNIYNDKNQLIMQIDHIITRLTNENNLITKNQSNSRLYYQYTWEKKEDVLPEERDIRNICLILDEETDLKGFRAVWEEQKLPVSVICAEQLEEKLDEMLEKIKSGDGNTMILFGLGAENAGLKVSEDCLEKLTVLVRKITEHSVEKQCFVRIVTRNACAFQNTKPCLSQSLLWGFAKTFSMEAEGVYAGIIDLDDMQDSWEDKKLASLVLSGGSYEMCIRNGEIYVSGVEKLTDYVKRSKVVTKPLTVSPDRTYLVAGGTGALGMTYIEALIEAGAKHIAVICRKEPKESVMAAFDSFRKKGAAIGLYYCDICNQETTRDTVLKIEADMPQVGGVINAGGVIRDKLIHDLSWEDYRYVLEPKVSGSLNLYQSVADHALDFFIMMSSITSIMGNIGQSNYAAANVFLNNFAAYLNGIGQNGYVFCWGPWSSGGMATDGTVLKSMEAMGLRAIAKEKGKDIILEFLQNPYPELMVVDINWNRFFKNTNGSAVRMLLRKFTAEQKEANTVPEQMDFSGLSREEIRTKITNCIKEICKKEMGYSEADEIDISRSFGELGADSLMMFSIRTEINRIFSTEISVSALYNYQSLEELVDVLLYNIVPKQDKEVGEAATEKERTKIYFLPYAGGSVYSYTKWRKYISDEYEVIFLEYPGRGSRTGEALCTRTEDLVADLYEQFLKTVGQSDYYIFGHSLGGLMTYELTRKIQSEGRKLPKTVFISGREPAEYNKIIKDVSDYPDLEFLEIMSIYGGIPNEMYQDEEMRKLFLPVLRADFKLLANYHYIEYAEKLDCNVVVWYGDQDENMKEQEVIRWKNYFAKGFSIKAYPGGHFYCMEEENSKDLMESMQKFIRESGEEG